MNAVTLPCIGRLILACIRGIDAPMMSCMLTDHLHVLFVR